MPLRQLSGYEKYVIALQYFSKKEIPDSGYENLDKKIRIMESQLSMLSKLKCISTSFSEACDPYEHTLQKERQDLLSKRLTSDDGNHFQSVEDLDLYLRERDEYKKYRQETLTHIVPLERQDELLAQAEACHFKNPITCRDLTQWKTELLNCHKVQDSYSRSFELYFWHRWKVAEPEKVVGYLPLEVQTVLADIPYISITKFITVHNVQILPRMLSFSTIDAWLFASDFYIGVIIPNRSESHIYRAKELEQIQFREDVLSFYKTNSSCETVKFTLPSNHDPDLANWINLVNYTLAAAHKQKANNLCPVCGKPLFEGAMFCGSCGCKL